MLSIFLTLYTSAERNSMSLPPVLTGGAIVGIVSFGMGLIGFCPLTIIEDRMANDMKKAHLFMMHRIS
jgi:hypothetical protein